MSPIRVGLIGLASKVSEGYTPGEWGVNHLKALGASPYYQLVAVCNSSVESAAKAIEFHGLEKSTVKAYGSPQDLAADKNVDMVVVSVSVEKHVALATPSIEAGKDIFIEYPVAPTIQECEALYLLAEKCGVKTMTGTQAYSDPAIAKLRELVETKTIGDIVSTVLVAASPIDVSQGWPDAASMFLDLNGGANRIQIVAGHLMGAFVGVLGDFKNVQSVYKTQTKSTTLVDGAYQPVRTEYPVTVPDIMSIQGILTSGAIASVSIRMAVSPVDDTGFRWIISGTEGEIEWMAKPSFVQSPDGSKITLRKKGSEPEEVSWATEDSASPAAKDMYFNMWRAYDAFAKGNKGGYADLTTGIKIHRILDKATSGAIWAL